MGKSMRAKKRSALGYQIAIVVLWFGGEVAVKWRER
jgi:hypothetical protein